MRRAQRQRALCVRVRGHEPHDRREQGRRQAVLDRDYRKAADQLGGTALAVAARVVEP